MKAKILLITVLTSVLIILSGNLFSIFARSSDSQKTFQKFPKETPFPKPITGLEEYETPNGPQMKINPNYKLRISPVQTKTATVFFSSTGVNTVYDLQTNAVPQQIWQDPLTPSNVHATMMYSAVPGFATRGSAYFFSNDFGATWTFLGDVPNSGRSGFPAISGYSNGAAVIANHNNTNGTSTRTKLYFDAGPGFGVFSERDPGDAFGQQAIWPRVVGIGNDKMSFIASINGAILSYNNSYNNGVFSGYVEYPGDQAESYSLAIAPNGIIGNAYIGNSDGINDNDVFYRFSTDNGVTWSNPQLIWDWNISTDSLGCLRGVSVVFGNNSEPYVAFNISLLTETGFFPTLPSSIRVWSPGINGGVPKVIADQTNVPLFGNTGATTDAFLPVCRPAIGRSSTGSGLVVAFLATTGQYGSDTSAYYAAWAAYTGDGGNSWVAPERMTPSTPLRDWRFVSVSPTNSTSLNQCTAQMTCLSDSLPGTHVNGAPIGVGQLIGMRYVFPLNSTPAGPSLLSPANNSINIPRAPLMDWGNVSNADTYRIQISASNAFTNNIVDEGNLTASEYQVGPLILNYGTTYYWRVNGTNINGIGAWSVTYSFTTETVLPPAPALVSPANNSTGTTQTPTLDWNNVSGALTYGLQVATDTGFSNTVVNLTNLTVSQYTIPASVLTIGTKYYWRANAVNVNGTGDWSGAWNFTTLGVPNAPALLSPSNGATQTSLTPLLVWSNISGVTNYSLTVAADSNFTTPLISLTNLTASSYNVPSGIFIINTIYYWRVNGRNASGTGPWSSTFNFRTISAPSAPVLSLPANNASGVILTPFMDWENVPNGGTYNLQIALDSNFSNLIIDPSNLTLSQYTVPAPFLTYQSIYYWRARAINGIGTGDWSVTFNFTTLPIPPPAAPALIAPPNSSVGVSLTPLLDWTGVSSASSYGVQISSDVNFNNLVHSQQNILNTEYTVPSGVLNNNTLYFWRVNAVNSFGTSPWSTEWIFRTLIVGIENIGTGIPENFMLHNNFPNPFNPSTKIGFDLPEAADVEITVFDFLGRKIKELVKEKLPAGSYRTEFDAGSFASGIYFYRIRAGKFTETKRMLLVK